MWLLLFTIPLVWTFVLTIHLARHYRVLVRLVRWTAWVYLLILSVVAAEVLREGFIVLKPTHTNHHHHHHSDNGNTEGGFLQRGGGGGGVVADVGAWWFAWFVVVALSAVFPLLLVPAVGLPVLLLRHPAFRLVVDFGLARLGWTAAVYNPVGFWYGGVIKPLAAAVAFRSEWVAGVVERALAATAATG
ncbi:uncharacterized protein PG998_013319 [Apiospora kogelbergensis]|uniref:uncharacterized protein n=1 Tax=Apiospora kogelbergensis TaxID=1337665 RepID=UPI00312D809B